MTLGTEGWCMKVDKCEACECKQKRASYGNIYKKYSRYKIKVYECFEKSF